MKYSNTSFLFFYILPALFIAINPDSGYSQNEADSLGYYYKAILYPSATVDLPNGIAYFTRQKDMDLTKGDTLAVISDLRMIAIGQFKIGNIYDSEGSIVEALGLIDQLKEKDTLVDSRIGLYNQLGRIYRISNNHPEAIKALDEALRISRKARDSITILNNKANIYKDLNEFELALDQYQLVYDKCLSGTNNLLFAMVLDNLGYVQAKLNSPGALGNLNKALDMRKRENELTGIYASYKNLAHYNMERNNREQALFYADSAYEATKRINSSAYTYDALALFMEFDQNPKTKAYRRLTDSISEARQLAENKNAFMKYNLNEERKKTAEQELQREREKRSKLVFQASTLFIFLLLIASYLIFRYRYRKGKQEQIYQTETRISKKIHDELSNDVYKVMARLQHDPGDPSVVDQLQHIYRHTRNISRENSPIDTGDGFREALSGMLSGYIPANAKLILKGLESIHWKRISREKKVVLYRVLQELMTNMNKHSKASFIAITFNMLQRSLKIGYSDNGVGMGRKPGYSAGGLRNAENRISSVRGSFTFDTSEGKGFNAEIRIPC